MWTGLEGGCIDGGVYGVGYGYMYRRRSGVPRAGLAAGDGAAGWGWMSSGKDLCLCLLLDRGDCGRIMLGCQFREPAVLGRRDLRCAAAVGKDNQEPPWFHCLVTDSVPSQRPAGPQADSTTESQAAGRKAARPRFPAGALTRIRTACPAWLFVVGRSWCRWGGTVPILLRRYNPHQMLTAMYGPAR